MNYFSPLWLLGASVTATLLSALVSLAADRLPGFIRYLSMGLLGLSGLLAVFAGLSVLISGDVLTTQLPLGLPWLPWQIRLDGLAGFFLAIIGIITLAISIYGPSYIRDFEHSRHSLAVLGIFTALFITGMQLVVVANDAFMFMVSWELMSVASYFLVVYQHEQAANRRAAFLYLLMAEIGALSILLGYGVLAGFGSGFSFDAMRAATLSPGWANIAFIFAFLGFGMKAGLVPLHVWLPEAHPVAPSHISALMSGVMLKVAVYGFIRFCFDLLGNIHWSWGVAVLVIGSVSALLGILYAMVMQQDMKRFLAYSSVENVGIIFIGLGLSMLFAGTGHPQLAAMGLVAALYHALNHSVFKSLLFLGAGAIMHTTHQRDMNSMGGLLHRMPWTGLFFLIGSISISALPPFNGFVSEWLTFQTALQAWTLDNSLLRSLVPFAAATLALTGALAAASFVKAFGISFLGQPRSKYARNAKEVSIGMRCSMGLLAVLCIFLGVMPTAVINLINGIPKTLLGHSLQNSTAHGWLWLTPIDSSVASYSAPYVLLGLLMTLAISVAWLRYKKQGVRRCDAWSCGSAAPDARMQYTATAFAQPIRRVFALLFDIKESVTEDGRGEVKHQLQVTDRLKAMIYDPIGRASLMAGRLVGRLQTGNVRNYLGWTLGTLLVLLWVIS